MESTNYRLFLIRLTSVRLFADDQRAVDACIREGNYYNAIQWLQRMIDWIEDLNSLNVLDNLKRLKADLETERANILNNKELNIYE
jgi:hypothetical protein